MTKEDDPTTPPEAEEPEAGAAPGSEETEAGFAAGDEETETASPPDGDETEPAPEAEEGESPRRRPLYYNLVSHIGALVVILGAILILLSLFAHVTSGGSNPYIGIFTYVIFPTFVLGGVFLILMGMRWEAGRRRHAEALKYLPYPRIDLNETRQRRIFLYTIVGGTVVSSLLIWASYQGFHYTESVTFCGQVCHVPMQPEFTAYKDSPHARVPCVACHVGEGASWYVRSKLSGARQLYAVLTHSYETPIPTPVAHLRPARETCERCHWPEKFSGAKLLQLPHYRYNETNDAEQISLNLKIGGGNPMHGKSQGIHWHMVVNNTITFAATDKKLQHIPWVKVRHADGSEEVYVSKDTKLSAGSHREAAATHHGLHGLPQPAGARLPESGLRRGPGAAQRADPDHPALGQEGRRRIAVPQVRRDRTTRTRASATYLLDFYKGSTRRSSRRARTTSRRRPRSWQLHLRPRRVPEDEGGLAHLSHEPGAPRLAGLLPLS